MTTAQIISLIVTFVASSSFSTLIIFFVNRHDQKKGIMKKIEAGIDNLTSEFAELRKSDLQTKLLMLMADYPTRYAEIFKVAERYFVKFNGNDFVTPIFKDWLRDQKLERPSWFKH